jgi:exo-beta-1,3-glucanase (GH17 family)
MTVLPLGLVCLALLGPPDGDTPAGNIGANRARFYDKLSRLRWIDYNPSTFDPERKGPVPRAEIEADLKALIRAGFVPAETGLCTYNCSSATGLDQVPRVGRGLGFGGVILGVWTIDSDDENATARRLAREGLMDAVCVGNEGLDERYQWKDLKAALEKMRGDTGLPVSTSEQIDDYGDRNLTDPNITDFVYPNIHPVFRDKDSGPISAARWTLAIAKKLAERTHLPILVHETGLPSQGADGQHTPENQRDFWVNLLKAETDSGPRFVLFEAFDQRWKSEVHRGVDIGRSWGLFDRHREPKCVVRALIRREVKHIE